MNNPSRAKRTHGAEGELPSSAIVRRLRRRYTRVVKRGNEWACFLQIDHQGFCVVDDTDKKRAAWYSLQLAKALARMITTNAKSPSVDATEKAND